jgi:cardiolipin synthase
VTGEQISDRILTVPNVVSFVRLLGVGVFWWVLLGLENHGLAAVLIFVIGWTDWIDGYLARRLNQVSKLGKALDPIADRLMIASAVIGGMIASIIPLWVGWLLIAREVFMGVITLVLVTRGLGTLEVRYLGKLSTFILYGAIPSFYFADAGILEPLFTPLAWTSAVIGLVLYWIVAWQYLGDALRVLGGLESRVSTEES